MENLEKFREELNKRIEVLLIANIENPTSFYYQGCLGEAQYLRAIFNMNLPKESEVEHV